MQAFRFDYKVPTNSTVYTVYFMSDVHVLKSNFRKASFERYLKMIEEDEHAIVIGCGDYGDFISQKDLKRWSYDNLPDDVFLGSPKEIREKLKDVGRIQSDLIIKYLAPLAEAEKIAGLSLGNHEDKFQQYYDRDVQQRICDELDVPNLGHSAFVNLGFTHVTRKNNSHVYRIFVTHGTGGGGRTAGNKYNKMAQLFVAFDADCVVMGHTHTPANTIFHRVTCTQGFKPKIKRVECRAINPGSFCENYREGTTSFEERMLFPAQPNITYVLKIKPFTGSDKKLTTWVEEVRL